jgi:mRNA-degrading endonuclease RelE of RelBE toxin-antitoxin system
MEYIVNITEDAWRDLQYFKAYEQRIIVEAIDLYLSLDAQIESGHRKKLRPNPLAPWEMKTDKYRAFYKIEEDQRIDVVAIGYKEHNELFIRGEGTNMITIDLRQQPLTIWELLQRAETDIVRIVSTNGQEFMLVTGEESFAEEARRLGQSERFMQFLAERAKQPATISLQEVKQRIGLVSE